MNTKPSTYVGREFVYRGSRVKVVRYEIVRECQKFWCEPQDNKSNYAAKGGQFPLSKTTICKMFKGVVE